MRAATLPDRISLIGIRSNCRLDCDNGPRHVSVVSGDNFLRLNRLDEGKDGARKHRLAGLKALTVIDDP
jgi:hypothetical protein